MQQQCGTRRTGFIRFVPRTKKLPFPVNNNDRLRLTKQIAQKTFQEL